MAKNTEKNTEKTTEGTAERAVPKPPEPKLSLTDFVRLHKIPLLQAAALRIYEKEKYTAQEWKELLETLLRRGVGGRA